MRVRALSTGSAPHDRLRVSYNPVLLHSPARSGVESCARHRTAPRSDLAMATVPVAATRRCRRRRLQASTDRREQSATPEKQSQWSAEADRYAYEPRYPLAESLDHHVVWVVQAGRGMVRGHDQSCGSTPAQPAVGPHPAPAAAPTAAPPRRGPPPCPRPQLRGRAHLHGPHLHPWNLLPAKELGCGSATTCWRRLDEWARAGVFEQLQDELGEAGRIDLERVSVDSFSLRAVKGGSDRRQSGRSRQGRVQAACGRRRWRPAPCRGARRRQRPRLDHVGGGGGRHPTNPDADRLPPAPAGQGPRRQGL
jgi:transposase